MRGMEVAKILLDMLDCPDCDIKLGKPGSKVCKDHLISALNIISGMTK